MGFSFVPISIAALAGVKPSEAGLASGLINTSQQVGGALGIAALSAIATSTTTDKLAAGARRATALTDGFQAAFTAGAAVGVVGILVALFVVRGRDMTEEEVAEAQPPSSRPPSFFEWAVGRSGSAARSRTGPSSRAR